MLKNKINVLVVMFLFFVVCHNSFAMNRAIVPVKAGKSRLYTDYLPFSPVYVDVPPFGGDIEKLPLVPVQERVWGDVKKDMLQSPEAAGRAIATLSLINKDMHGYVKSDKFLDNVVERLYDARVAQGLHPYVLRGLIEGSKQKRLEGKLYAISYPHNGYAGDIKADLEEIFGAGLSVNHKFNSAYDNKHRGLNGGTPFILISAVSERMENDAVRRPVTDMLLSQPGINLAAQDDKGKTALMWSVSDQYQMHQDAFDALYDEAKKGRDVGVNCEDEDGNTVLTKIAKRAGTFTYNGQTILGLGAQENINKLVGVGANFDIPNQKGETAMSILQQKDPQFAADLKWKQQPFIFVRHQDDMQQHMPCTIQ